MSHSLSVVLGLFLSHVSRVRELWFVSQYAGEACGRGSGAAAHRGSADGQIWRRHDAGGPDVQRRFRRTWLRHNHKPCCFYRQTHSLSLLCHREARPSAARQYLFRVSGGARQTDRLSKRPQRDPGRTMSTLHCNCVRFWGLKSECSSVMAFVSLSRPWLNVLSWDRSLSDCWVSTRGTWPWLLPTSTGISSTPSMRWRHCCHHEINFSMTHLLF